MVSFWKKNNETATAEWELDLDHIPEHVAIIMDGNGRWAQQRHLPRIAGHKEGMNTVKKVTKLASDLGIKVLTLYAFSTENWKRPETEVSYLMGLPIKFFDTFVPELIENNVRVEVIGYIDQLPSATRVAVENAIEQTKNNTGMVLNFALNYGGRAEIVTAVQEIATKVQNGTLPVEAITTDLVSQSMMTAKLGEYQDPDVVIRTSGEIRISNFLLWQVAYSEFVFLDTHWPDMDETSFKQALAEYQQRNRRFGGLKK
ncbi:isoprenyl transferase [Periweissella ghanensis]|uniref:Isoprenyl transferase n=1 Tax=Periweissella ghanensis TaxID=467997 RepID=A0ABM8ZAC4_9LACO|nr:isoprenyl transferase [Periweissella ghanensis]CAH0418435.1 Ditrans,polycis-undecaprenyl-diphosphate synthase ((2E,6E)-farnesyl-diphosphate specific) [Periweissella ghanensis]